MKLIEILDNDPRIKKLTARYAIDCRWRESWINLSNNLELKRKKYPLQAQDDHIQRKASQANERIYVLMKKFDAIVVEHEALTISAMKQKEMDGKKEKLYEIILGALESYRCEHTREAKIEDTLDCWLCEKPYDEMLDKIKSGHKITCIRCKINVEVEIEYLELLL